MSIRVRLYSEVFDALSHDPRLLLWSWLPSSEFLLHWQVKLNTPLKSWMATDLAFYKKPGNSVTAPPPPPPEFEHKPGEIHFPLEELKGALHNEWGVSLYFIALPVRKIEGQA